MKMYCAALLLACLSAYMTLPVTADGALNNLPKCTPGLPVQIDPIVELLCSTVVSVLAPVLALVNALVVIAGGLVGGVLKTVSGLAGGLLGSVGLPLDIVKLLGALDFQKLVDLECLLTLLCNASK